MQNKKYRLLPTPIETGRDIIGTHIAKLDERRR
jgi:hypothetical protein